MRRFVSTHVLIATLMLAGTARAGGYAAVRSVEGELDLERPSEVGHGPAERNQPLTEGDRLTTGSDGRAELVLPDGSRLWLDRETRLDLVRIERGPLLRLWRGTIALVLVGTAEGGGEGSARPRVDTPTGSILPLEAGRYQIAVASDGLHVRVEAGLAEVGGSNSSVLVRGGERTSVYAGEAPETPYVYNTAVNSSFETWVEEGRRGGRAPAAPGPTALDLPAPIAAWAPELGTYGTWRWHPPLATYVWTPTAVRSGWRPFVEGRWASYPDGLTWISPEPWGYATYHFGAWDYASDFGWFWLPGSVYSPAWVNWYVYDDYVGWCPPRSYTYWDVHRRRRGERVRDHDHDRGPHDGERKVYVKRDQLVGTPLRRDRISTEAPRGRETPSLRERLLPGDLGNPPATQIRRYAAPRLRGGDDSNGSGSGEIQRPAGEERRRYGIDDNARRTWGQERLRRDPALSPGEVGSSRTVPGERRRYRGEDLPADDVKPAPGDGERALTPPSLPEVLRRYHGGDRKAEGEARRARTDADPARPVSAPPPAAPKAYRRAPPPDRAAPPAPPPREETRAAPAQPAEQPAPEAKESAPRDERRKRY